MQVIVPRNKKIGGQHELLNLLIELNLNFVFHPIVSDPGRREINQDVLQIATLRLIIKINLTVYLFKIALQMFQWD